MSRQGRACRSASAEPLSLWLNHDPNHDPCYCAASVWKTQAVPPVAMRGSRCAARAGPRCMLIRFPLCVQERARTMARPCVELYMRCQHILYWRPGTQQGTARGVGQEDTTRKIWAIMVEVDLTCTMHNSLTCRNTVASGLSFDVPHIQRLCRVLAGLINHKASLCCLLLVDSCL